MLNTVVRQIAFVEFERRVHDERRSGELTPERIGEIWLDVQRESLGPGDPLRGRVSLVLDLYPAFHPHAVLCLRLCLRRLPGEFALCGLSGRASGLRRRNISTCCAPAAPSGTRSCWRRSASTRPTRLSGTRASAVIAGFIDRARSDGLTRDGRRRHSLGGRVRRYARVSTAMGGLAARLAGERYLGIAARPAAPCRRSQGGARRHQGAADEGGAAPRHHPQRAAAGIRAASWRRCRRTRRRWAGPSSSAAWRASSAPTGSAKFKQLRARGGARRLARPGPSRRRQGRARCSPASCNIPTWPRRSRPICSSSSSCCRSTSATTAPSPPTRSTPRSPTRLREELDYEREAAHMRLYRLMLADETGDRRAGAGAGAVDAAAPDHDLARRHAAARGGEGAARRRATTIAPQHVPRLVRAVLLLRRHPRRSASRQLHGAARSRHQPAGFRLRPHFPAALRQGRDRSLSRARPRRRGARRRRL